MIPVSIRTVVKDFGPVRALDQVSVEISKGELFFLLGPSGCGKTTLLRTIAGFYTPQSGQVLFGERDVTYVAPQHRNTGMVFQNYALWPHMTVEANVAYGLRVRRVARAERQRRVAEALERVHMREYARRKPNQLSGGQQQRVALARALVIRPQCLLLDEPLSNLDAKLRLEMRTEIRRLCKDFGLTGVYVTHDQKEALSVADRMAVMFQGKISQVGTPRELYTQPANRAIADFLGEANFLPAEVVSADGTTRTLQTPIGTLVATSAHGAPPTGTCIVSIRPEAVLIDPGPNVRNRLRGQVIGSMYLGEILQLTLTVGETRLQATTVARAGQAHPAVGDKIELGIDSSDLVVLPE